MAAMATSEQPTADIDQVQWQITPRHQVVLGWAGVAFAATAVAVTAIVTVTQRMFGAGTAGASTCEFSETEVYCRMAGRAPARSLTLWRPLSPLIARGVHAITGWDLPHSFLVPAFIGFVLAIVGTALVANALADALDLTLAARRMLIVIAVSAWLVTPFALRFWLFLPTMTDILGTGLCTLWLGLVLGRSRHAVWLAPVVAAAAVLNREVVLPFFLIAGAVVLVTRLRSWTLVVPSAAIVTLGFVLASVTDHDHPNPGISGTLDSLKGSILHPFALRSVVTLTIGFALIALTPTALWRQGWRGPARTHLWVVAAAALGPFAVYLSDMQHDPRIASPATPLLCVVFACWIVSARRVTHIALGTAAFAVWAVAWKVVVAAPPTPDGYVEFFRGRQQAGVVTAAVFGLLCLVAMVLDAKAIADDRQATGGAVRRHAASRLRRGGEADEPGNARCQTIRLPSSASPETAGSQAMRAASP